MVPDSSAICLRSSRILSGSGSSCTRSWRHQPLPLFNKENKVGLCPYQPLRRGRAIEISRNQLLEFAGLQPHVAPEPGDVAIEQNQIAVHRSLRAKIMVSGERRPSVLESSG